LIPNKALRTEEPLKHEVVMWYPMYTSHILIEEPAEYKKP